MKRVILLLSIFAFVSLSLSAQRTFNDEMRDGIAARESGNFTEAIQHFLRARELAQSWAGVSPELNRTYDAINRRISTLGTDLQNTRTRLSQTETNLRTATADLNRVQTDLNTANAEIQRLQGNQPPPPPPSNAEELRRLQVELAQARAELARVRAELTEVSTQNCAQYSEFIRLLPQLTNAFLRTNYPRVVCRALRISRRGNATYKESLVDEFLRSNYERREHIIYVINRALNR